jgi:hypothetical protein
LVEIACFSERGILVPAGIVTAFGSGTGAGAELADSAVFGVSDPGAGVAAGVASCASDIPTSNKTVERARIATSNEPKKFFFHVWRKNITR